jgi:hypothetical protein
MNDIHHTNHDIEGNPIPPGLPNDNKSGSNHQKNQNKQTLAFSPSQNLEREKINISFQTTFTSPLIQTNSQPGSVSSGCIILPDFLYQLIHTLLSTNDCQLLIQNTQILLHITNTPRLFIELFSLPIVELISTVLTNLFDAIFWTQLGTVPDSPIPFMLFMDTAHPHRHQPQQHQESNGGNHNDPDTTATPSSSMENDIQGDHPENDPLFDHSNLLLFKLYTNVFGIIAGFTIDASNAPLFLDTRLLNILISGLDSHLGQSFQIDDQSFIDLTCLAIDNLFTVLDVGEIRQSLHYTGIFQRFLDFVNYDFSIQCHRDDPRAEERLLMLKNGDIDEEVQITCKRSLIWFRNAFIHIFRLLTDEEINQQRRKMVDLIDITQDITGGFMIDPDGFEGGSVIDLSKQIFASDANISNSSHNDSEKTHIGIELGSFDQIGGGNNRVGSKFEGPTDEERMGLFEAKGRWMYTDLMPMIVEFLVGANDPYDWERLSELVVFVLEKWGVEEIRSNNCESSKQQNSPNDVLYSLNYQLLHVFTPDIVTLLNNQIIHIIQLNPDHHDEHDEHDEHDDENDDDGDNNHHQFGPNNIEEREHNHHHDHNHNHNRAMDHDDHSHRGLEDVEKQYLEFPKFSPFIQPVSNLLKIVKYLCLCCVIKEPDYNINNSHDFIGKCQIDNLSIIFFNQDSLLMITPCLFQLLLILSHSLDIHHGHPHSEHQSHIEDVFQNGNTHDPREHGKNNPHHDHQTCCHPEKPKPFHPKIQSICDSIFESLEVLIGHEVVISPNSTESCFPRLMKHHNRNKRLINPLKALSHAAGSHTVRTIIDLMTDIYNHITWEEHCCFQKRCMELSERNGQQSDDGPFDEGEKSKNANNKCSKKSCHSEYCYQNRLVHYEIHRSCLVQSHNIHNSAILGIISRLRRLILELVGLALGSPSNNVVLIIIEKDWLLSLLSIILHKTSNLFNYPLLLLKSGHCCNRDCTLVPSSDGYNFEPDWDLNLVVGILSHLFPIPKINNSDWTSNVNFDRNSSYFNVFTQVSQPTYSTDLEVLFSIEDGFAIVEDYYDVLRNKEKNDSE